MRFATCFLASTAAALSSSPTTVVQTPAVTSIRRTRTPVAQFGRYNQPQGQPGQQGGFGQQGQQGQFGQQGQGQFGQQGQGQFGQQGGQGRSRHTSFFAHQLVGEESESCFLSVQFKILLFLIEKLYFVTILVPAIAEPSAGRPALAGPLCAIRSVGQDTPECLG